MPRRCLGATVKKALAPECSSRSPYFFHDSPLHERKCLPADPQRCLSATVKKTFAPECSTGVDECKMRNMSMRRLQVARRKRARQGVVCNWQDINALAPQKCTIYEPHDFERPHPRRAQTGFPSASFVDACDTK